MKKYKVIVTPDAKADLRAYLSYYEMKKEAPKNFFKFPLAFPEKGGIIPIVRRYSSLVEHQLPKLRRRVRFPLSALS